MSDGRSQRRSDYERGFERCVVTFIDILGYRNLLNTPTANEIVGIVIALRTFTQGDGERDTRPTRSDEVRVYSQAFSESVSDAVVRVRTVDTQSNDGAFVLELIDLMHVMLECVNRGILIRGGMTIGPVHVGLAGDGPIFGNGMVRAFKIESEEAVYPRIMIDDAALEDYLADEALWRDGNFDADEARLVREFVGMAEDGSHFVDYLRAAGPGEFDAGVAGHFEFLQRHRRVIIDNMANADPKAQRVNRRGMLTPDRRSILTPGVLRFCAGVRTTTGIWWIGQTASRLLNRQLSLPVSTMSQWWVSRSSSAVVILASPKTEGHSPNARLVVTTMEVCS